VNCLCTQHALPKSTILHFRSSICVALIPAAASTFHSSYACEEQQWNSQRTEGGGVSPGRSSYNPTCDSTDRSAAAATLPTAALSWMDRSVPARAFCAAPFFLPRPPLPAKRCMLR
jgi:hypothetical protein